MGVGWVVGGLKEGLEGAQLVKCLLLLVQMLLYLFGLGLELPLGLVLVSGQVLDLGLESDIFGLDCASVLPFLQVDPVREGPAQYFYAALVEDEVEGIFLHFESVLVVEDGVERIHKGHWGQVRGQDAVLEGWLLGEPRVDRCLYHFEEDERLAPVFQGLFLLLQLLQLVFVPQNAYL